MSLLREVFLSGALLLGPAVALASLVPGPALRRWCLGAALSPVALGLSVLPLRLAGQPLASAGLVALFLWAALCLARFRSLPGAFTREERDLAWRLLWIVPLVFLPPLVNQHLLSRSDAWFHASVVAQVRNLPLPPQDPYYAGLPLQYFWFFHLVLSVFDSLAGLHPFVSMWLFNTIFFAVALTGAYALSRRIGASHAAALWTPWLVVAGNNAVGWLWVFVHGWKADPHWSGLLPHLPDYAVNLISLGYSGATAFSLDKFLVGTAFSWALGLFIWWAVLVGDCLEGARPGAYALAGALAVAALLVHTVAGFAAYAWGALSMGLAFLVAPSRPAFLRSLGLGAVMGLGLLLVSPYLVMVTQAKSNGGLPTLGWNGTAAWTTFWVGAGTLPLAALWAPELWRAGGAARWTLLLTAVLLLSSWAMRMPMGNESKFLNLGFLLLCPIAAPAARELLARLVPARPRLRGALMAGLFAPTTAFLLACAVVSRGQAAVKPDPASPGAEELRLYQWVREYTPTDAILLTRPPSLQALVRAERAQVWSRSSYAMNWSYPESEIRPRQAAVEDAFGGGLTEGDRAFLKSLGRPVYRLARDGEAPAQGCLVAVRREGPWVAERLDFREAQGPPDLSAGGSR